MLPMDNNSKVLIVVLTIVSILGGGLLYGLLAGEPIRNDQWLAQLFFAAGIIGALLFLFIVSIAVYVWGPAAANPGDAPRGKTVFESMKTIIPPLITLILGYYFGSQTVQTEMNKESQTAETRNATSNRE